MPRSIDPSGMFNKEVRSCSIVRLDDQGFVDERVDSYLKFMFGYKYVKIHNIGNRTIVGAYETLRSPTVCFEVEPNEIKKLKFTKCEYVHVQTYPIINN